MSSGFRINRLLLSFLTPLFPLVMGCSTTRFVVIDASTQEALECVRVDGYRFHPQQQMPSDFAWNPIDGSWTTDTGSASLTNVVSIFPSENEFRYVFTKPGYQTAEALVYRDKTLVASPADGAGWMPAANDPRHLAGDVPTRNFVTIPGGDKVVVQIYPNAAGPTTAPATGP